MVAGACVHRLNKTVSPRDVRASSPDDATPDTAPFAYNRIFSGRYFMDISIIATIGFTTAAVIGIIVLIATAGKKKDSQN